MDRRKFIQTSTGAAASAALFSHPIGASAQTAAKPPAPPQLEKHTGPVPSDDGPFWNTVRSQFPLTRDRIYLNTGGLGAAPFAVIDAVKAKTDELEAICETGHTDSLMREIKEDAAVLFNCRPDELAFTRNTTEGINIVAHGLHLQAGDEVILTTQEHVGNAITWVGLQQTRGVVLKRFEPSTSSDDENCSRLRALITPRTKIISIPHILTTTGLVMPVRDIAPIAHEHNIFFFVDGAQACGMMPVDLHAIGCDAYATSGHKWLMGPKETGMLYVRKEMLDTVRAEFIGAYSDNGFDFKNGLLTLHPSAQRYEYGTVSVPLRVGLGAAFRFIRTVGMDNIWKRDRAMSNALFEGLKKIGAVRVLSPDDESMRSTMITIAHASLSETQLQERLNAAKLRTRIIYEGGIAGLRLSLHCYNSFAEVERILAAVRSV